MPQETDGKERDEVEDAALLEKRKLATAAVKPVIIACGFMWMERLIVSQPAGQLVLSLTKDSSRTATIMAFINSFQSILKLVIAPVVGSLSDKVGRRPFLMLAPPLWAITRMAVVLSPSVTTVALSRTLGHALFDVFQVCASASIMDLHAGDSKGLSLSFTTYGSAIQFAVLVGPAIGGYLTDIDRRLAFAASAAVVLAGWGVVGTQVHETLPPGKGKNNKAEASADEEKKGGKSGGFFSFDSDSHPFSFLRLLSPTAPPKLRTLAIISALRGIPDQAFIVFQFAMTEKLGWGPRDMGTYLSAYGLVNLAMRKFAIDNTIARLGNVGALRMSAFAAMCGTGGFGAALAPSTAAMYGLLLLQPFAGAAETVIKTMMAELAASEGIGKGSLSAMMSNLEATIAIAMPLVCGKVFSFFISKQAGPFRSPNAIFYMVGLAYAAMAGLATTGLSTEKPIAKEE